MKIAEPQPDAAEDIEVCLVKLERIPEMIRNGELKHSQSIMGLSTYLMFIKES
jgi:hypothetical protein